jgi:hypothetical protein
MNANMQPKKFCLQCNATHQFVKCVCGKEVCITIAFEGKYCSRICMPNKPMRRTWDRGGRDNT